jgi:protein arginine N-methyltransferase 1
MYTLASYGDMIADQVRLTAYAEALRRVVRPGCVVLDLGAGAGIMTLLACRLGARRIFAIEPDDAIHIARELVAENGFADRVTFYQDLSTRVTLPERADVIVADLRGALPLFGQHLPALADARRRLLAPGGVLIPRRDVLWAAVAEAPDLYHRLVGVWEESVQDLRLTAARRLAVNAWAKQRSAPEQLLTAPASWATLEYATCEEANATGSVSWQLERTGTAHGLCLWFDAELVDDVGFSNAPGKPELIYGHLFVPLAQPAAVIAGDRIDVTLEARLVGDDYLWRWETRVCDAAGAVKAHHRQSTLAGMLLAPGSLRKRAADHVPVLSEDGELDRFILAHMDGVRSLEEIARQTAAAFAARFPHWLDALPHVGSLAQRYGR